jgi:hypothetical protein
MKTPLFLMTSFLISCNTFSQENITEKVKDSTLSTRVNGKILVANAGFAPIPAFSFNSLIVICFLSLKKKRFSYEPDFALGLNGKPWMANNWFRLTFIDSKKIKLNAGINPSLFFKNETVASGEEILNALRNLTFELVSTRKFSKNCSLSLTYMLIHAFDRGALSGNYFDISSPISVIKIAKVVAIDIKPQLFYFDFTGNVDGFFASTSVNIEHHQIPLSIYFQGVLPLWTDFPGNNFKWNTGFVYTF